MIALFSICAAACSGGDKSTPAAVPHTAPERIGFTYARIDRPLSFPRDYGSHPDYQTEWWYYTGNLEGPSGRHFGYQLTFFRRALKPPAEVAERTVPTAANDIFMGHLALTDVDRGEQYAFERFGRGADPVAGVRSAPHAIWLDDWRVEATDSGSRQLTAGDGPVKINLELRPTKGPIAHGVAGYSRKGPDPEKASHYYSFPRLQTIGTIEVGGSTHAVRGASWMDHEFTSSGLAEDQIGWDWFSIQLDNDVDLMLFHLRTDSGEVDPYSSGSLITADGAVETLDRDRFEIATSGSWLSPRTGAAYPAEWRIRIPDRAIDLQVRPHIPDQELALSFSYWEGAVEVEGSYGSNAVTGNGYAELTGYARSMKGAF